MNTTEEEKMQWMELSLDTTKEGLDWIFTLVAETIDIQDVYINEYLPSREVESIEENLTDPKWAFTINLYLSYDGNFRSRMDKIINLLLPLERTELATGVRQNIVAQKQQNLDKFNTAIQPIGNKFLIVDADAPPPEEAENQITLKLNKSLAFGSGFHPATVIILKLIERYILPGMNTLDFGCGSGILSVAMAKLGANVLALDNDNFAVEATQDAIVRNQVEQQVTVMAGSLGAGSDLGHWMGKENMDNVPKIQPTQCFDFIAANILARIHINLAHDFQMALRRTEESKGILVTSGYTVDREEDVTIALQQAGFELIDCERSHEWVALAFRLL